MRTYGVAIPVVSDFALRTTAATLGRGLQPDGLALRATVIVDRDGNEVWRHDQCDNAQHHVELGLAWLRDNA